ncbi:MAG: hypothetical protein WCA81_14790 [Rhizomicrobium sp.]
MGDTFLISGLREKRSAVAGEIVDLRHKIDKLQADLVHIDAVLKIYGLEPAEIPNKGRMPVRSAYFGRNELSRRCREMLREKGTVRADDVAVQAMKDNGMDPDADRKTRADFIRRILVSLHDLRKAGMIEKMGHGRGVRWKALGAATEQS